MVAISIIKKEKYTDLEYQVQKAEFSELFSNYCAEDSFLFEESFY